MKKIIAMLLALAMLASFAGCAAEAPAATEAPAAPEAPAATEAPAASEAATEAAASVATIKEGKLTVAISPDFAPMEFVDPTKTGQDMYVGFDVFLAKYLAEEMGLELELMPMDFGACQAAVSMGKVDMSISGFSWTEERAANYNLSDYYYAGDNETEQVLITTAENAGKFTTAEAMAGLKVGAQAASLQENLCKEQLPDCELVVYTDINTGALQLKKGDFDVMAVATGNADSIIAKNPELALAGFNFEVSDEESNNLILLQKGNDAMTEAVNELLAKAYEAGYYGEWYAAAEELAGIGEEVSYDENGNPITG